MHANVRFERFPTRLMLYPLLIALAVRVTHALTYFGFKSDDEHWQVIEPAGHLIFGAWHKSWEWNEGLRSWIYPWIISLPMGLAKSLQITDPIHIVSFIRIFAALFSLIGIWIAAKLAYQLSRENHLSEQPARMAALCTAWFLALLPFAAYCGSHLHGEMPGAVFFIAAALALTNEKPFQAGALLGCALAIKIDLAVAGAVVGLWYLIHRRFKDCLYLAAGAAPFVFLVGLVDKITWGTWFQNVLTHAHANLIEAVGNQWGVSPWYQHIIFTLALGSIPLVISSAFLPWQWKRCSFSTKTAWVFLIGFVAVFSFVEHKEKRFMAPLLYLAASLGISSCIQLIQNAPIKRWLTSPRKLKIIAALFSVTLSAHLMSEILNYTLARSWHERVLALRNAGLAPGIEKMISCQWPATFYFPRSIPTATGPCTQEYILNETKGLRVVSVAHDGKHMGWWEQAGFECAQWPHPARISQDPVPTAWRCERKKL